MAIAPARTGSANSSRNTVTSCDHTNSGIRCSVMPGARMLKMVVMKLIAPRIELAPARWMAKITRSKAWPVGAGGAGGREWGVDGPAGAGAIARPAVHEHRGHQQHERRHQQPERHVVHT